MAEVKKSILHPVTKPGRASAKPPPQFRVPVRVIDPSLPNHKPQGWKALLTVLAVMGCVFCIQHIVSPWERDRLYELGGPQIKTRLHERLATPEAQIQLGAFRSDLLILNTSQFKMYGEAKVPQGALSFTATFRIDRRNRPVLAILESVPKAKMPAQSPNKRQSSGASKESKQNSGSAALSTSR